MTFNDLDKIDLKILQRLLEDGRTSFSNLAKEVSLTDVAVKKRFDRLIRKKIISSVSADLNYKELGFENPVFIQIRTELNKTNEILDSLREKENIIELYQMLGEYNVLAKLIIPNIDHAEKIVSDLSIMPGIVDIKSSIVISKLKKKNELPNMSLQSKIIE